MKTVSGVQVAGIEFQGMFMEDDEPCIPGMDAMLALARIFPCEALDNPIGIHLYDAHPERRRQAPAGPSVILGFSLPKGNAISEAGFAARKRYC
jgi:hypothetical protein